MVIVIIDNKIGFEMKVRYCCFVGIQLLGNFEIYCFRHHFTG